MSETRGREYARLVAVELAAEAKRRRLLYRDVAAAAGIGAEQFSYYLSGARGAMSAATMLRACEYLHVEPQTIAERAYSRLIEACGLGSTPASAASIEPREGPALVERRPHARSSRGSRAGGRTAKDT